MGSQEILLELTPEQLLWIQNVLQAGGDVLIETQNSVGTSAETQQVPLDSLGPSKSEVTLNNNFRPIAPTVLADGATTMTTNMELDQTSKPFVCHWLFCDERFSESRQLNEHIRSHVPDRRPFACPCGNSFKTKFHLQRHQIGHTGEKRFRCPQCSQMFMRYDSISRHIKTGACTGPQISLTSFKDVQSNES